MATQASTFKEYQGEHHSEIQQLLSLDLSPRENEVLKLIAMGYSNREIASELRITESTVKSHLSRVMESWMCIYGSAWRY